MEIMYINCDRCGDQMVLDNALNNRVDYKNATLCLKCHNIRRFDDDNPIMYPIYKD